MYLTVTAESVNAEHVLLFLIDYDSIPLALLMMWTSKTGGITALRSSAPWSSRYASP